MTELLNIQNILKHHNDRPSPHQAERAARRCVLRRCRCRDRVLPQHAVRTVVIALALLAVPALARAQAAAGYTGNESCKTCHAEAYEAWKTGPHARALASLGQKAARDGRCVSCHAP